MCKIRIIIVHVKLKSITVLYCTVLYCTVLYCNVLYCTILYCFEVSVRCTNAQTPSIGPIQSGDLWRHRFNLSIITVQNLACDGQVCFYFKHFSNNNSTENNDNKNECKKSIHLRGSLKKGPGLIINLFTDKLVEKSCIHLLLTNIDDVNIHLKTQHI